MDLDPDPVQASVMDDVAAVPRTLCGDTGPRCACFEGAGKGPGEPCEAIKGEAAWVGELGVILMGAIRFWCVEMERCDIEQVPQG